MPIRKRNGIFQVRVALGSGRRAERSLPSGAKLADAKALEATLKRAVIDEVVGRPRKYTIAHALDRWEESEARSLRSWQRDVRYRAAVVRDLAGDRPLDDLPTLADEIKRKGLSSGLSAAGTNRYLAIVRRVANLAERWSWTDKPLGRRIENVPGERPRDLRLEQSDVIRLMAHADPRLADFVAFLALTGMRRSEALRLTPADIRDGAAHIDHRSKSGRPRVVPLAPAAAKIAARSIPFELGASNISRLWREARVAAGLPAARLHDIRHHFASLLVERGTSPAVLREILGHASLNQTSRYTHAPPAGAAEAVRGLRLATKKSQRPKGQTRVREKPAKSGARASR